MTNGLLSFGDSDLLDSPQALFLLIFVPLVFALLGMSLFASPKFSAHGRTILITGGSQGMGLSLAQKLSSRGANIAIVARDTAKLESSLSPIRSAARSPDKQRFLSLSYDLTDPASAPEILRKVTEWNNNTPPDVVWMCAGYCIPSFFADASIDTLRSQMDTLYWSAAYIAHATLNLWKQQQPQQKDNTQAPAARYGKPPAEPLPRHLVFTCSALAFFPIAGYAPYSPAKSAMRILADTLQEEVAVWNGARKHAAAAAAATAPPAEIKVHTIFPMGITSPSFSKENELKPAFTHLLEADDKPQSPDEVAEEAIKGLEAGKVVIATVWLGRLMLGAGMAGSIRTSFMEVVWSWLGSIVAIFVGWDFLSKANKWGKEKGMATGPR